MSNKSIISLFSTIVVLVMVYTTYQWITIIDDNIGKTNEPQYYIEVVEKWNAFGGCRYTIKLHGFRDVRNNERPRRFVVKDECNIFEVNDKFKIEGL